MTGSGMWEIWFKGDMSAVRHCVGKHTKESEAKKQWKRLTFFASPAQAAKYEMLIPSVRQQLSLKESEIANRGKQVVAPGKKKTFEQICLEKIDQKRKTYVNYEKHERNSNGRTDHTEDKKRIQYGIAGIRWAMTAYHEWSQTNIEELMK